MGNIDNQKIKVGISIGDINGIGMEIIIKSYLDSRLLDFCTPIVYGSSSIAAYHLNALNINDFNFYRVNSAGEAEDGKANIINAWDEKVNIELGKITPEGGKYAFKSLEAAVRDLKEEKVDVLVTAPINKKNIHSQEFNFAGHTEYLASVFNVKEHIMLMITNQLRVGLVTGHIPLSKVAESITKEKILKKLEVMQQSLKEDFTIRKPRIAVLALNPHAGDDGLIGTEDKEIIAPAVKEASDNGMLVYGPYGADGFFGAKEYANFDGILAMYHDQGLIPFKTMFFEDGVNYTAGLPVVRTSPDHGPAFELSGEDKATENSFRQAIYHACDIYRRRKEYKELTANPLKVKEQRRER